MQNFEEDLGATLLDRNTKPLKPTPMGLRVYEQCKAILREIDSLRELVANDGAPSGTLRLGVPQTLGDVVLLDALAQIRDTYPVLRTQVTSGWVLNPDGCGFRAGLQRALSEQGLSLSINLETIGTDLQLGLVASGQGLGLWLFHPRYLGNLQEPVELFGEIAGNRLQA
ncbi:hypothetical protein PC358_05415 [Pseudomonas capeferrum]|nr:hypothetical protein PC358_05415 [Pseudomonas capeferrum]